MLSSLAPARQTAPPTKPAIAAVTREVAHRAESPVPAADRRWRTRRSDALGAVSGEALAGARLVGSASRVARVQQQLLVLQDLARR